MRPCCVCPRCGRRHSAGHRFRGGTTPKIQPGEDSSKQGATGRRGLCRGHIPKGTSRRSVRGSARVEPGQPTLQEASMSSRLPGGPRMRIAPFRGGTVRRGDASRAVVRGLSSSVNRRTAPFERTCRLFPGTVEHAFRAWSPALHGTDHTARARGAAAKPQDGAICTPALSLKTHGTLTTSHQGLAPALAPLDEHMSTRLPSTISTHCPDCPGGSAEPGPLSPAPLTARAFPCSRPG